MFARQICTGELADLRVPGYAPRMATTLAKNISALRQHLGLKQTAFAERIGVAQSYISKWEKQDKVPEIGSLEKLAEIAGVSTRAFRDEEWSPLPDDQVSALPPRPMVLRQSHPSDDDTVEIIQLDLSLSMGPGTLIEEFIEEERARFGLSFIRNITRTPTDRLRIVRGIGDSMEPTLRTGDRVLIDINERQLSRMNGVYWVDHLGTHGLKRLRAAGRGRVMISSDNPHVPDFEVDAEDLRIEGRAIWFARDL